MRPLVTLLLILALETVSLPVPPGAALSLPWRQEASDKRPVGTRPDMAPLQEVSPPEAVQQLQAALGVRQPVVEILSPQPDSLLPAGPWMLRLRVHDWPLVDGGALGLGPHLVVQLDQEPPRIWTNSEGELPELSPGSHRLTVYAALPWGEARKNPGATAQIRLHRTAPNPQTLPAPGSPQLLAVSPSGQAGAEPLLLDWLLLDAPLQDVGGSGTQWRLRVSINGDDVLLDQQSPLWLQGWRPGVNALRLELLDARGEPLNPPFNSLVQEVALGGKTEAPRWRGGPLNGEELAILLGEAAAPPAGRQALDGTTGPPVPPDATPAPRSAAGGGAAGNSAATALTPRNSDAGSGSSLAARTGGAVSATIQPPPASSGQTTDQRANPTAAAQGSGGASPSERPEIQATGAASGGSTAEAESNDSAATSAGRSDAPSPSASARQDRLADRGEDGEDGSISSVGAPGDSAAAALQGESAATSQPSVPGSMTPPQTSAAGAEAASAPSTPPMATGPAAGHGESIAPAPHTPSEPSMSTDSAAPTTSPPPAREAPSQEPQAPPITAAAPRPDGVGLERVRASTELAGRARDLVNDDGTLRRPERQGPLAALRARLQR